MGSRGDRMKNIAKALLEAQKKIENASKDAKNPHYKNNYATLESVLDAVKEAANAVGIAILQTCGKDAEGHFVESKLIHESGEEISSRVYLVLDKQNMQGLGSAITYGRRYSLAALFAIGQDDDDGNGASKPANPSAYTSHQSKQDAAQKSNGFGPRPKAKTNEPNGYPPEWDQN